MSKINGFALFFALLFVSSCASPLDPLFEFKIAPDVSIKTLRLDDKVGQISTQFSLQTTPLKQGHFLIVAELLNEQGRAESFSRSLQYFSNESDTTFTLALTPVAMPSVWSESNPKLYTLIIKILGKDEQVLTQIARPFSFKKVRFESTGLYLNSVHTPLDFQWCESLTSPFEKNKLYLMKENASISNEKWTQFNQQFIKTLLPISGLNNPNYNTQPSLLGYYTTSFHSIPKPSSFPIQLPLLYLVEKPLSDTEFYSVCKQVDAVILKSPSLLSNEAQQKSIRPIFQINTKQMQAQK